MEFYIKIAAIALFVLWNIIVFALYAIDKSKAKKGNRRISEKTLLVSAAFMGGLGALIGMQALRHKTKHLQFTIGVPLLLVLNIAVIGALVWFGL